MKSSRMLGVAVLGLCLTALAATPAQAYWNQGGPGGWHPYGPSWHDHEWRARHDWNRWHGPRPGYVYGPPVVAPPPPPVGGINLVLPLNFN